MKKIIFNGNEYDNFQMALEDIRVLDYEKVKNKTLIVEMSLEDWQEDLEKAVKRYAIEYIEENSETIIESITDSLRGND